MCERRVCVAVEAVRDVFCTASPVTPDRRTLLVRRGTLGRLAQNWGDPHGLLAIYWDEAIAINDTDAAGTMPILQDCLGYADADSFRVLDE